MHIMQIKHVRLHPKAENEITKKQYEDTETMLNEIVAALDSKEL